MSGASGMMGRPAGRLPPRPVRIIAAIQVGKDLWKRGPLEFRNPRIHIGHGQEWKRQLTFPPLTDRR